MARWKNENGEWVYLGDQRYGWIDYKKQASACKTCDHGPWGWGAGSCADICQQAVIYILEFNENGTTLYSVKITDDNKAEPDKVLYTANSLLSVRELWQYLIEQGVAPYLP
jgi:hypothetical protein